MKTKNDLIDLIEKNAIRLGKSIIREKKARDKRIRLQARSDLLRSLISVVEKSSAAVFDDVPDLEQETEKHEKIPEIKIDTLNRCIVFIPDYDAPRRFFNKISVGQLRLIEYFYRRKEENITEQNAAEDLYNGRINTLRVALNRLDASIKKNGIPFKIARENGKIHFVFA